MPEPVTFPSVVRSALIDDHTRLREKLRELEVLAERQLAGRGSSAELHGAAQRFRQALAAHNQAEEEHLEDVLAAVDAWGEERVDQMLIEHLEEHKSLLLALLSTDAMTLARAIPAFAADLRAHMEREENGFLSAEVLRDSLVTVGPTS